MPNWCNNLIEIKGPADKIRALWARAQKGHEYVNAATGETEVTLGLLEAMTPIGEWDYDTAIRHWGTKWDIEVIGLTIEEIDHEQARIYGSAESAWSPPIEAFQAYAKENKDVYLAIRYFEPGLSFIGTWNLLGRDDYWENVDGLIAQSAENEDSTLMDLFEDFNVWDWYEIETA